MQILQKIKSVANRAISSFFNSGIGRTFTLLVCGLLCFTGEAMASSKGAAGFTKATTEVSSYQTPVSNLMKAIAAVIALVGAFNVYFKMQNGDQDVKKNHHAHHRRLCFIHRLIRGVASVLQLISEKVEI